MSFLATTYGAFTFIDIAAGVLLLAIVVADMRAGLIRALGNLIGALLAIALAGRLYDDVGGWIPGVPSGPVGNVVGFVVVYLFVSVAVGIVVWTVDKIFSIFKIIPGLGFINTLGGAVVGLVKGSLVIGTILFFLGKVPFSVELSNALDNSSTVHFFLLLAKPAVLLLPESLKVILPV